MESKHVLATFRKLRAAGYPAAFAMDYARTLDAFEDAENEGRARIRFVPDESSTLAESFDESAYTGDRQGKALWKELERLAEREGFWGAIAEVRREPSDNPASWSRGDRDSDAEDVDSLFGLLGSDFGARDPKASLALEYRLDMMRAALKRLRELDAEHEQQTHDVENVREFFQACADESHGIELLAGVETGTIRRLVAAFERIAKRLEDAGQ